MPVDLRHRSHASRAISHPWFTNLDELFFQTWLITKTQSNFPENTSKKVLNFNRVSHLYLNPRIAAFLFKVSEVLKGCRNIFRYFGQCSEILLGSCLETPVMTRQKSYAFYSEKLAGIKILFRIRINNLFKHFNLKISIKRTLSFGILPMKAFL